MKSPWNPLDADVPARDVRVRASLPGGERKSRVAGVASLLLHAMVIYLAIRLTASAAMPDHSKIGDAIKLVLGGGGGGGGQRGTAFVRAAPPPPIAPPVKPPPVSVPVVTPPPVAPEPVPLPAPAAPLSSVPNAASAATGTGTGGGNGTGLGPGTGSGQGPGSGLGSGGGNGAGRGASPPVWKQTTLPPTGKTPKKLRGKPITVTFSVDAEGRTLSWTVSPAITDHSFAKLIDEVVSSYRWFPAKDADGKPIPGTVTVSITLY